MGDLGSLQRQIEAVTAKLEALPAGHRLTDAEALALEDLRSAAAELAEAADDAVEMFCD